MDFLRLGRWRISLAASLTAVTGAVVCSSDYAHGLRILLPGTGTLLLAMGASALNQVQEKDIDARMERTRFRPLPAGRVTPGTAGCVAGLLLGLGLILLALLPGWAAAGLGAGAVVWYNGVYTYLKRVSAFAAVPGAVVGAVPPAIGWLAAGGRLSDPRLLALALFFFLWQIPHFWLLLLASNRDYESVGLPTLTAELDARQLSRILCVWVAAAAAAAGALPLFHVVTQPSIGIGLAAAAVGLATGGIALLRDRTTGRAPRAVFRRINAYIVLILVLLMADKILSTSLVLQSLPGSLR